MSPAVHDKLDATINDLKGKPETVNKRLRYKLDSTAVRASADGAAAIADGGAHAGAHARTDDQPDARTDADAHAAPYSSAHAAPHRSTDGQAHVGTVSDADGRPDGRGRALALRARRRVQDGRRERVPHLRRDARRR